eukprot:1186980-Prorocentrum_minimum.AAC.3
MAIERVPGMLAFMEAPKYVWRQVAAEGEREQMPFPRVEAGASCWLHRSTEAPLNPLLADVTDAHDPAISDRGSFVVYSGKKDTKLVRCCLNPKP